jgi:hypothetical protein
MGQGDGKYYIQRIQSAGKSMQVLDVLFENLRPEGVFVAHVDGVHDEETANAVLRRVERRR